MKPYALPVQLISYTGLDQSKLRSIINGVIAEMTRREMKVAGEIFFVHINIGITCAQHICAP